MQIDVVNVQNEKVGSLDLRDEVFGGRVKTDLIHESVVHANAAARRGTHALENRLMSEVHAVEDADGHGAWLGRRRAPKRGEGPIEPHPSPQAGGFMRSSLTRKPTR